MNIERAKFLLRCATAGLTLSAAAAVALVIYAPGPEDWSNTSPGVAIVPPHPPAATTTAAADLDALLDLELRMPLAEIKPVPPPVTQPVAAALPVRLTGTIVEAGHSYAIFLAADGTTEVRSVGERVAGAEVTAIDDKSVSLRYNGRPVVLRLPVTAATGQPG